MRVTFNEKEQLVIASVNTTEKMALARWKEAAFSDENGAEQHVVVQHNIPGITVAANKAMSEGRPLYCSYCGQSQYEVEALIAGPSVIICNDCILLCSQLIDEYAGRAKSNNDCEDLGLFTVLYSSG
jgi:hypothetical protein